MNWLLWLRLVSLTCPTIDKFVAWLILVELWGCVVTLGRSGAAIRDTFTCHGNDMRIMSTDINIRWLSWTTWTIIESCLPMKSVISTMNIVQCAHYTEIVECRVWPFSVACHLYNSMPVFVESRVWGLTVWQGSTTAKWHLLVFTIILVLQRKHAFSASLWWESL